jgi:multiple sugar transport system ATP-binding protein
VLVGIRPENLHAGAEAAPAGPAVRGSAAARGAAASSGKAAANGTAAGEPTAALQVKVAMVESLGHEVLIHGRLGAETVIAKVDPHRAPAVGDELQLAVEIDKLHLFDTATEQRLVV